MSANAEEEDDELYEIAETEKDLESDLLLAAELGKTLLDRNSQLESLLLQHQQINDEQHQEIEFLTKQIEQMREWNETRFKVYDQLDSSILELETKNEELKRNARQDKDRIERLTASLQGSEKQAEELQMKVESLQQLENEWKQLKQQERKTKQQNMSPEPGAIRRYRSCENGFTDGALLSLEEESKRLHESARFLHSQINTEKKKSEKLQVDLFRSTLENNVLEKKLRDVGSRYKDKLYMMQSELQAVKINYGKICKKCKGGLDLEKLDLEKELDEDIKELQDPEVLRTHPGASVYGNRDTFMANECMMQSLQGQPLLSEIHTHYRKLVEKYEEILQKRGRRSFLSTSNDDILHLVCKACHQKEDGSPLINTEAQTEGCASAACGSSGLYKNPTIAQSDSNIVNRRFQHGPPEYKKLFAEIFDTLRKQCIVEARPAAASGRKIGANSNPGARDKAT